MVAGQEAVRVWWGGAPGGCGDATGPGEKGPQELSAGARKRGVMFICCWSNTVQNCNPLASALIKCTVIHSKMDCNPEENVR